MSVPSPGGYGWVLRVWAVVAVFAALTLARSAQVGIPLRDPHGAVLRNRVALSVGLFVVLVLLDAAARAWRDRSAGVVRVLRTRWTGRRLALTTSGLLAYHCVYFCYHNLKSWDVLNRPRDGMLLAWDRWLFLGHDPAALLHQLLGQHLAAYVLMVVYESFSTLASVAFVAALVLVDRARDGYVAVAAGVWVWILGVGSYYAIPSLGPFHAAPRLFAGLPHTMIQDTQARYVAQRAHLLAHPHAADAFAQISAFASLHVGVTCTIWLLARYYGLRRLARVLAVFLAGTVVATVYLGWHFAVDDVAGALIAVLAVRLGRLLVEPRFSCMGASIAQRWLHGGVRRRHDNAGVSELVHDVRHGEFGRTLSILTGVGSLITAGEIFIAHDKASFGNRWMWLPVALGPVGAAAGVAGLVSETASHTALPLASASIVANGLQGTFFHVRGVGQKPGGWRNARYNLEMGPPLFAPLLMTMVGGMGLVASLLRRKI